jgi:GalNAc-alpha-(1->4)-GalNAc-alpha-(1->3)-diNAcBac-PP-undecaprenol alpha-1,4-N-acetyl-D-galactosaminyltransferase
VTYCAGEVRKPPMHDLTLVISRIDSGGAQRVLTTLANAWVERGLRLCIITMAGPESDFFRLDPRITRLTIGGLGPSDSAIGRIARNLGRIISLRRAIRRANAPTVMAFIGVMNILTVLAAVGLGLRVVISERNDPARQSLGRVWDILRRIVYPLADTVIANSRGAIDTLGAFVPGHKLAFAPNPLVLRTMPATVDRAPLTILAVGRLTHQKAYDILLQAFAQIFENVPAWHLVVLGEGELEGALKRQARRLGVASRIDWIGRANNPFPYYAGADIFALPSRYEGTPNALLEAMSMGLPAIVSDASTGPLDFIEDAVSGLVVPVDDVDALAVALTKLTADAKMRRRLGAAARTRVSTNALPHALAVWTRILNLPG